MEILLYFILAIPFFFLIRKLLSRYSPKLEKGKLWISALGALVFSPVVSVGLLFLFFTMTLYEYHPNRDFSVESWEQGYSERFEMQEDLLESKLLMGKSNKEVEDMLGKAEVSEGEDLRYSMGSRSWGMGIKFYYLDIVFQNGVVTNVEVEEILD